MASENNLLPRAVILTALPLEYLAVKKHISEVKEVTHDRGNVYETGIFDGEYHTWDVLIAEVGAGNNKCALETERAINYYKPEVIVFVGIAGGIKDLALGDVVAANKAYGYEHGKSDEKFLSRPEVGKSSYALLERAKAESKKDNWKQRSIHAEQYPNLKAIVKPIAAGEKVVTSVRSAVFDLIYNNYNDTVAVEMEGSGFYSACHANEGLQFLIVRGISDLLENKSETDSQGYQDIAANNASAFAFEVLSKFKVK
jgi:nucleoside phosphorylase